MDASGAAKRLQSKVTTPASGSRNQSPERSKKRKDKWTTERKELPVEDDGRSTHRRRLQDPVPLEDDTTANSRPSKRGRSDAPERNSNPEYVPRSGHFYEHDDRSNWRNPRPRRRPIAASRLVTCVSVDGGRDNSSLRRNGGDGPDSSGNDGGRWRHDRFMQLERGVPPRNRGNPKPFESDRWLGGRRPGGGRINGNGRGGFNNSQIERGRWGDNGSSRRGIVGAPGGKQVRRPFSRRDEEWKHDLFDDIDDVPAAQREEDSVARAEALLAA